MNHISVFVCLMYLLIRGLTCDKVFSQVNALYQRQLMKWYVVSAFLFAHHHHDDYSILSTLSEFHVTKKVSPWRTDLVSYSTLLDDEK